MTATLAHMQAVVDAYAEGLQAGTELALQALDMVKELEAENEQLRGESLGLWADLKARDAENERLRHDLDVARAEVLKLTAPAERFDPAVVDEIARTAFITLKGQPRGGK